MKTTIWAAAITILGAGAALAQDKKGDDPRRDFERRMRELEERFRGEREKLEREFRERLQPRREDGPRAEGRAPLEDLVKKLIDRVERLERRLDGLGEFGKNFDFKGFRDAMPRFLPRFEDRDFRFEFRRKGGDEEPKPKKKGEDRDEDERKPAPKKKGEEKKERGF